MVQHPGPGGGSRVPPHPGLPQTLQQGQRPGHFHPVLGKMRPPFSLTLAGSESGVLYLAPCPPAPPTPGSSAISGYVTHHQKGQARVIPKVLPRNSPLPLTPPTPQPGHLSHTCFREEGEFCQVELSKS